MTRPLTILTLVAAAALAGCNSEDHTIVSDPAGPDPMANAVANAGSVTLPPSIQASKAYRCKDNSLIYVDWYSDGSARVKKSRDEVGAPLLAAGDKALTGDAKATSITFNGQSCKA
ncbi:hypothetical protein [Sphingomonas daechungensis]|uniref:hypothetical protein n=1 Tax=Sphingomonas daechungensis TaxID=1176646 RepID=UPI0037839114